MENSATKHFGRYEILGQLGRGSMGIVYKARDPQIDRIVALKTVPLRGHDPEEEQEYRRRFQNEAQAAGRLHHPGLVAVYDVGEEPETHDPFIVLEFVDGEPLNRRLHREKKLPVVKALQIAEEVALALDYAHGQGVVHRDIKPGNILMTQDGHPKIADFGIAKLNLSHQTLPGKVLGTPAYMAPEQLAGKGATARSDLFSLGAILYALVVGHSPFQGENASTVCFQVANREPVPASAVDVNLPREIDAIIGRAMAKDPKARFQRGKELAEAVQQLRTRLESAQAPAAALKGRPALGFSYAAKRIRAAILKAPLRDIALGLATIVMLVIVGVQSHLMVSRQNEAANPAATSQPAVARTKSAPPAPKLETATVDAPIEKPVRSPAPVPTTHPTLRKASAHKSAPKPAAVAPRSTSAPAPAPKEIVVPLSMVELAIRHQFKDAKLLVFVDEKLALTRPLHGAGQKKLVVFGGVHGVESETLKLPAGKHTLRFEAQTADHTVDLSKTISADFIGGDDKTLEITFEKHNTAMHLSWQ